MNTTNEATNLPDFLKPESSGKKSSRSKRWWIALTGIAALTVAAFFFASGDGKTAGQFTSEEALTGNLLVSITASGTLQPTRSVDVGSELSGTLAAVLVDENDRVSKGQVIARLDASKLEDAVAKSRAAVAAANANVALMAASVAEARANLDRQRHVAELSGGKVPSKAELDTADAAYQRALANVDSAKASVLQAKATLNSDETNISKAVIRAPINGVVLSRKVEPGQTVAATMTAPVLFTIAEDLTKMELQVKVDEADVGNVQLGQSASFTVSAWSGRDFPASILRVGIGSTTTDNVVTYKTVLGVANDDLALRPGMTATARIITASRQDVLLVPNAALRFTPPATAAAAQQSSLISRLMPRPPRTAQKTNNKSSKGALSKNAQVWVEHEGGPVAIPVMVGASNGRQTEITSGDLKAGMRVITDFQETKS